MKKKNVFVLSLAFVMGAIVCVPVFAQENEVLSKEELTDLIKPEIKDNSQERGENFLKDSALDYLSAENVLYYKPTAPLAYTPNYNCSVNKDLDYQKIQKILKSKEIPNVCMQFDIMSYLIYNKHNDELQKALDIGYDPRLEISIAYEKTRDLFNQAVLSNNKDALTMLYNKMLKNGLKVYKHVGIETMEEVMRIQFFHTLSNFIHDISLINMSRSAIEAKYENVRESLSKSLIGSEFLKDKVVQNDRISYEVAYNLIPEKAQGEIALNALYKLIDYRIEKGY